MFAYMEDAQPRRVSVSTDRAHLHCVRRIKISIANPDPDLQFLRIRREQLQKKIRF